jgi:hypothetical protein
MKPRASFLSIPVLVVVGLGWLGERLWLRLKDLHAQTQDGMEVPET